MASVSPHHPSMAPFAQGTKTVASTSVPEALVASATYVKQVIISALRTNGGDAFVGASSVNGAQHLKIPATIVAPPGTYINLAELYVDVTVNGEGVAFLYNT